MKHNISDTLTSLTAGATGIFCGVNWDLIGSRCLTALSTLLVVVKLYSEFSKWRLKRRRKEHEHRSGFRE